MKKALLIGINYPGTAAELRGCVNDVMLMKDVITEQYGFNEVKIVTDNDATTSRILRELNMLVDNAVPGDYLYFHFSGHGVQMPSIVDAEDGLDECICPSDFNWRQLMIRDVDMQKIFNRVPKGVRFTVILDCCHSGHGLNQEHQYTPTLSSRMGLEDIADDTPRVYPDIDMPGKLKEEVARRSLMHPRSIQTLERGVNQTGLLLATCQSFQTSADAWIDGRWIGAGTHFIAKVLSRHNHDVNYKIIVDEITEELAASRFSQRPELNGPAALFMDPIFTLRASAPLVNDAEEVIHYTPAEPVQVTPQPVETTKPTKKKTSVGLIIGLAVIVAFVLFSLAQ